VKATCTDTLRAKRLVFESSVGQHLGMPKPSSMPPTGKLPPLPGSEMDVYLEQLDHPLRDEIVRVRRLVLAAAPSVQESFLNGLLSFQSQGEPFASIDIASEEEAFLVLRIVRPGQADRLSPRPLSLIGSLSHDQARVSLAPGRLVANRALFLQLVREWIDALNPTS
jgi:hypothetical protein